MKISITLLLCMTTIFSFSQVRLVKKCIEIVPNSFTANKKSQKRYRIDNYVVFDKNDNAIKSVVYGKSFCVQVSNKDSSVTWYCGKDYRKPGIIDFTFYRKDGKKTKTESWRYTKNQKPTLTSYTKFSYNEMGWLIQEITTGMIDSAKSITSYIYNSVHNNIGITDSNFSGTYTNDIKIEQHYVIQQFDTLNRLKFKTRYSADGFISKEFFSYSSNGDTISISQYKNNQDIVPWSVLTTHYSFSDQCLGVKNKQESFYYNIDGDSQKTIYRYNKHCLLEQIEIYSGNNLTDFRKYKYTHY